MSNLEHSLHAKHCKYFSFNLILGAGDPYEVVRIYYPYLTNKDTGAHRGQAELHREDNQVVLFLINLKMAFLVD